MEVKKGKISTVEGEDGELARVVAEDGETVTMPLAVPKHLRGELTEKDTPVIYVEFTDYTGAILMRADGEETEYATKEEYDDLADRVSALEAQI